MRGRLMGRKRWTIHDLAGLAEQFSRMLLERPNQPIEFLLRQSDSTPRPKATAIDPVATIRNRLEALPKQDLIRLIKTNQLPVTAGPKDSAAKLVSRVMRQLSSNRQAAERLSSTLSKGSPELARALRTLRNFGKHGKSKR